jgi:carbon-monoxide dehydrogenase medium subunit
MKDFEYHNPESIKDACKILKKYKDTSYALAGGTDLIPKMYLHQLYPEHIINLKNIPDLNKISFDNKSGLTIGTLVRFNDIIYSELIKKNYPILIEVSKQIASHQVRNLATIGGNLCNAAPSADSAPALIALDSTVNIADMNGKRRIITLETFFTGPGTTALQNGEILTQINIPLIKPHTGIAYIKHTTRKALEIAVVGVCGLIQLDDNLEKCLCARIVVGASAPTPLRVLDAENCLIGNKITEKNLDEAAQKASAAVKPISDVRASDNYRREMVQVQTKRVLEESFERAKVVFDKS